MAKESELPDPIEKRNILASKEIDTETLVEYGKKFLSDGSLYDAFNYFEKAGYLEGLEGVKARAVEEGLTAVLYNLERSRHIKPSRADWEATASNAVKLEKYTYAAQAFRKLGDEERLAEMLQHIPGAQPAQKDDEKPEQ